MHYLGSCTPDNMDSMFYLADNNGISLTFKMVASIGGSHSIYIYVEGSIDDYVNMKALLAERS